MLRVDPSLFANVVSSVQRTGSLTGGAVRGLPGGAVLDGLQGVNSFGADLAEAQKEFELGRVRSSLERVKQVEIQFNGIAGRWNSMAASVLSSARQGHQKVSLQKLNEVKAAQSKMQQLMGPATKSFRDLVAALEHAVTMDGRSDVDDQDTDPQNTGDQETDDSAPEPATDPRDLPPPTSNAGKAETAATRTPDPNQLGSFAGNYRFGERLERRKRKDGKSFLSPSLQADRFYFFEGLEPARVLRIREIERKSIRVFDAHQSTEYTINVQELGVLVDQGIWELAAKT